MRQGRLAGRWQELTIPSHESSCQLAFGGRRANNRPSSCFSTFRAPPPLLRQEELNSHPFRVISDTRVNTQKGEGRLLIVWTRKQFLSLQSDFRVTVGGGERVGDIDGILHAHTFYTATPIILAITPTATLGAANREQSGSSVREASLVTSQFVKNSRANTAANIGSGWLELLAPAEVPPATPGCRARGGELRKHTNSLTEE